jgi:hypothetical protein
VRKCASERQNKAENGAKGAGLQEKKPKKGRKMAIRRNYDTAEEIYVYVSVIFYVTGKKEKREEEKGRSTAGMGTLAIVVGLCFLHFFYSEKIAKSKKFCFA